MPSQLEVPVAGLVAAVIAGMRRAGYAESTIRGALSRLARLEELCVREAGGVYSAELGCRFAEDAAAGMLPGGAGPCGRLVWLADRYAETGVVDLSVRPRRKPEPAAGASRRLLAGWGDWMRDAGWAAQTVRHYSSCARRFLVWLEGRGVPGVDGAGLDCVDGFLRALRETCAATTMGPIKNMLAAFCRFAGRDDLAEGFSQVRAQRKRQPLAVLTDEESRAVADACQGASLRDAAIVLLALTTGLRACDICALGLDDIDWREGAVCLVQQKTGNPLRLPLPAAAGNAISRYLLEARPDTPDRHVFIREVAPRIRLGGNSAVRVVMKKVFDRAGVVPERLGTRLTRGSLASKMLAARVGAPTIAAVLGHADPASADAYLETDLERMRGCVLPLPSGAGL
ncbi:MAG: tyrosine-type recombinase/integrase [Bifidobacteriaceae bacterium]|nr:tyrosine-type recombinase/integrase [Bifidobacteriaceae bacterium]